MDFTSNFFIILIIIFYLVLAFLKRICNLSEKGVDSWVLMASFSIYTLWYPPATIILLYVIGVAYIFAGMLLKKKHTGLLWLAVLLTLVPLLYFKYTGFFASLWGSEGVYNIALLLPLGISFYVFTAVGYLVGVYREQENKHLSLKKLSLLISFWPHLAAGPILRASLFKSNKHRFAIVDGPVIMMGIVMVIGGAAKKLLIADNLGSYVNQNVSIGLQEMDAITALLTVFGFGGQIYADFSGYSEMAIGFALLIGFRLPANFNYPYSAFNITEFWRRWHISLSTWFRDFVYIPLGGRTQNLIKGSLVVLVVFLISGLWHGAAVSFVIWGGLHGLYLIVSRLYALKFNPINKTLSWLITFFAVNWAWVFFRFNYQEATLLTHKLFNINDWLRFQLDSAYYTLPIVGFLILVFIDHKFKYYSVNGAGQLEVFKKRSKNKTYLYLSFMFVLAVFFHGEPVPFIYFEF